MQQFNFTMFNLLAHQSETQTQTKTVRVSSSINSFSYQTNKPKKGQTNYCVEVYKHHGPHRDYLVLNCDGKLNLVPIGVCKELE